MLMLFTNLNAQAMGLFYTNATYPVTATGATVKDLSALKRVQHLQTAFFFVLNSVMLV